MALETMISQEQRLGDVKHLKILNLETVEKDNLAFKWVKSR